MNLSNIIKIFCQLIYALLIQSFFTLRVSAYAVKCGEHLSVVISNLCHQYFPELRLLPAGCK